MKTTVTDYLQYTKAERRGIYVLSLLFIIGCITYFSLPQLLPAQAILEPEISEFISLLQKENELKSNSNTLSDSKVIKSSRQNQKSSNELTKPYKGSRTSSAKTKPSFNYTKNKSYEKKNHQLQPFQFDPNAVSKDDLKKMNLSFAIINTLHKYRNKGGEFKSKKDLKKIYGMSDSIYEILEKYITIPEPIEASKSFKSKPLATISFFDINSSTAEDLQSLRGIGPVLSNRIIKFRDKLGGFYEVSQLKNTYGLEDSVYQHIKAFIEIKTPVKKINLNDADQKTLQSHPYISYQISKVIIKYREQHGPFQDIYDLKNIKILSNKKLEELTPYLMI